MEPHFYAIKESMFTTLVIGWDFAEIFEAVKEGNICQDIQFQNDRQN